jgi:hypothetical protein
MSFINFGVDLLSNPHLREQAVAYTPTAGDAYLSGIGEG